MKYLLILLLASCVTTPQKTVSTPPVVNTLPEIIISERENNGGVVFLKNGSVKDTSYVAKLNRIIQSKEFKEKVLNHKFKGKNSFHYTEKSPQEVLKIITTTRLIVEIERKWNFNKKVVAWTYPSSNKIFFNSRVSRKDCSWVGTLGHEVLGHKNGFDHEVNFTKDREYSVPYGIGKIVNDICRGSDGKEMQ
jgi:hypothetical protein